jgi:LruC domain-containing protein
MSYCNPTGLEASARTYPNPDGLARSAKFAYQNSNGKEYAIVSFEDACNDLDYDDIVLALKPADVFSSLPTIADKTSSTTGVYAFEDLWPSKGDYDMNDALVQMTREKTFSLKEGTANYKVTKETFYLTTDQNYVTLKSGLGFIVNTKVNPTSIVMKKVAANTTDTVTVTYPIVGGAYVLTEDVTAELGSTYILEFNYKNGIQAIDQEAEVKAFIYRTEGEGRIEVHIPYEAPTEKMITSYFGTLDDKSKPAENIYYVRSGNYPFAFYLQGVTIDNFKETLLLRDNEKVKISDLYPYFLPWAESKGAEHADWYLHPKEK